MGTPQYEYDSDEDTEGGTWEHKKRNLEMTATQGLSIMDFCLRKAQLTLNDGRVG